MPPERSPAFLPVLCLIATTGQAGSFLYLPAAGVAMLVMTGSGALALALYGQLAAGSVAGSGVAVAGLCALTLVGWQMLPAPAPVRP